MSLHVGAAAWATVVMASSSAPASMSERSIVFPPGTDCGPHHYPDAGGTAVKRRESGAGVLLVLRGPVLFPQPATHDRDLLLVHGTHRHLVHIASDAFDVAGL